MPPASRASGASPTLGRHGALTEVAFDVRAGARELFAPVAGLRARFQEWRPAICPLDLVLSWVPQGATVFDIGCGAGLVPGLLALQGRASSVMGVDADAAPLALAEAMAARLAKAGCATPLQFRQTRVCDEWPAGPFGSVTMVDVLHHIPPAAQRDFVAAAMARVAPGGRFIYKDMAARPLLHAAANRMHDLVMARQWIHYAPPALVSAVAAEAGLTRLHISHHRRWWYAHDLLVFARPVSPAPAS